MSDEQLKELVGKVFNPRAGNLISYEYFGILKLYILNNPNFDILEFLPDWIRHRRSWVTGMHEIVHFSEARFKDEEFTNALIGLPKVDGQYLLYLAC